MVRPPYYIYMQQITDFTRSDLACLDLDNKEELDAQNLGIKDMGETKRPASL